MSGRWECAASKTAGCKFAVAVPDVVITTAGRGSPVTVENLAAPSAVNAPTRSSCRTCMRSFPARSSATAAKARGALREPGHSTTSRTPRFTSPYKRSRAAAVAGLILVTRPPKNQVRAYANVRKFPSTAPAIERSFLHFGRRPAAGAGASPRVRRWRRFREAAGRGDRKRVVEGEGGVREAGA